MLMFNKPVIDDAMELIPWTSWTPTVTSAIGSITSYTVSQAEYKVVGKVLFWHVSIKITNIGTAAGDFRFNVPPGYPVVNRGFGVGRETDITGRLLQALAVGGVIVILRYDNAMAGPNNCRLFADGFYEIA